MTLTPRTHIAASTTPDAKGSRLVAVFLLGVLLFNYPVLALFNLPVQLFGIPLLYLHLFAAWALLIALMAWVVERNR